MIQFLIVRQTENSKITAEISLSEFAIIKISWRVEYCRYFFFVLFRLALTFSVSALNFLSFSRSIISFILHFTEIKAKNRNLSFLESCCLIQIFKNILLRVREQRNFTCKCILLFLKSFVCMCASVLMHTYKRDHWLFSDEFIITTWGKYLPVSL